MLKIYKSKSQVSLTVCLGNGSNNHISFQPLTGGGSVYYTHDSVIQQALESHHKYGRLFKLESTKDITKVSSAPVKKVEAKKKSVSSDKPVQFQASCNDDAKEYLAEKYGVKRTSMRNKDQINAAAKQCGVEIIWK